MLCLYVTFPVIITIIIIINYHILINSIAYIYYHIFLEISNILSFPSDSSMVFCFEIS